MLNFDGVEVFPEGPKAATRRFRKQLNVARHSGMAFDSPFVRAHPELMTGWPARVRRRPRAARSVGADSRRGASSPLRRIVGRDRDAAGALAHAVHAVPHSDGRRPRTGGRAAPLFPARSSASSKSRPRRQAVLLSLEEGAFDFLISSARSTASGRWAATDCRFSAMSCAARRSST